MKGRSEAGKVTVNPPEKVIHNSHTDFLKQSELVRQNQGTRKRTDGSQRAAQETRGMNGKPAEGPRRTLVPSGCECTEWDTSA